MNKMKQFIIIAFVINLHYLNAREIPSPPKIIKQPPGGELLFHVTAKNGKEQPLYLDCEATGEPTPKYRWIKNEENFNWETYDGRIIEQIGRGTLSFIYATDDDVGLYQCFAENESGVAMSNSVLMRKIELGNFKNNLIATVRGNEGESFKLDCQPPDGVPKPKTLWVTQETDKGVFKSINDSRITTDPEGNLWFSNLTMEDANNSFRYACTAFTENKSEYKLGNRVSLEVAASKLLLNLEREPVLQYVSKKNETVLKGKSVELFCIFGGTPLPESVWFKNKKKIKFSDRIHENNYGKSLVIKSAEFEDEGSYTCKVNNGIGEAKKYSINLTVLAVPYFTEEPEFITSAEEETVEFRCAASGIPTPKIEWIYNGKLISEAPHNPRRKVGTNNIVIENVQKEDIGNYGCNATNSLGYIYKDVFITVLAVPSDIVEPPKDVESVYGKNATLTCRAFGAPKPEVKWLYNNETLTGSRFTISDNGDLYINNVQFEDRGQYSCQAENKYGVDSASANLIIREHTEIIKGPENYTVKVSRSSVTFDCKAKYDANLEIKILWLHDDQEIDFLNQSRFGNNADSSLTISDVHELDAGIYTCLVLTNLDQAEASSTLIVQSL